MITIVMMTVMIMILMIKKLGRVETDGQIDLLWPLWIPSLTLLWHIIFDQKNDNNNEEEDKDGIYDKYGGDAKFDDDDGLDSDEAENWLWIIYDNGETDCDHDDVDGGDGGGGGGDDDGPA